MKKELEKSIGVRVSPELYLQITELCEKLGGIPVNNFAQNSIQVAIDLLTQKQTTMPKWIAIGRYALDFKKGAKI
jgi:hypothetical protein